MRHMRREVKRTMAENVLLKASDITMRFGGLTAVDHVNMELHKGEIVSIIGPNGAGKTTFFNIITGLYTPTEGRVSFHDKDITGLKPHLITALGLTRTFQNIRLFRSMTVIENVMVGMYCREKDTFLRSVFSLPSHHRAERETEKKALELLELTGLAQYRYEYASSLPYGLQRRLEIARAIASGPEIVMLDEPAAGMNEQETADLTAFIQQLRDLGYTLLLIEHDMRLVMSITDRIYVLNYGALIASGTPAEIRTNADVIEAYLGKEV